MYSFRFGKVCGFPSPSIDKLTENSIQVKWSNESIFDRYELRYRNKNKQDAKWYPIDGEREGAKIPNLEVNTQYEIQVHGFCGEQDGGYSPSLTTRTKEALSFNCGQNMGAIDLSNKQPLQALKVGDYFHAADFDVMVSEVTGSNGNFTGKGFVRISMLNFIKFQAEFKSIKVNTDYRMIDGEVRLINDPKNSAILNLSNALRALNEVVDRTTGAEVFDKNADETKVVDGKIASISVDSKGRATVTLADRTTKTVDTDSKNKFTAISSKSGGDRYMVSNTGDIYKGTPDKTTGKTLDGKKTSSYSIAFEHDPQEACGLDKPRSGLPDDAYENTSIGGSKQLVAWKSIENGTLDRVVAKVEGGVADSIHFATQSGTMVMAAKGKDKGTDQLLVAGTGDDALKAWYLEASDTTKVKVQAGQLNLVAYDKQTVKLCLVGINGAAVPEADYVQNELNKIYSSAVVDWQVSKMNGRFEIDLQGKFEDTPSDGKMDYSDQEKKIRDAFMKSDHYNSSITYLFFIENPTITPNIMGYMPFNRQFGFIFCKNTTLDNLVRTMAHELGHGCFRLRHTFSTDNQFVQEKGTTDNLMDYADSSPTVLRKYQWDGVRKFHFGVNWFEDGSEAKSKLEESYAIYNPYNDDIYLDQKSYKIYNNAGIVELEAASVDKKKEKVIKLHHSNDIHWNGNGSSTPQNTFKIDVNLFGNTNQTNDENKILLALKENNVQIRLDAKNVSEYILENFVSFVEKTSGLHFSRKDRLTTNRYDHEFWNIGECLNDEQPASVRDELAYYLSLKDGKRPSDAIISIFQNPNQWSIDCAEFVQINIYYCLIKIYGKKNFDQYINSIINNSKLKKCIEEKFTITPQASMGIISLKKYSRYSSSTESFLDESIDFNKTPTYNRESKSEDELLSETPIGSRIAVKNLQSELHSAWQYENAVKIGPDLYAAHGWGDRKTFSLKEIKYNLASETIDNPTQDYIDKNIFVAEIEIYDLNIIK